MLYIKVLRNFFFFSLLAVFSFYSKQVNAEEILSFCVGCEVSQAKDLAKHSVTDSSKVNVVDLVAGTVKSYQVITELDSGSFTRVISVSSDTELAGAVSEIGQYIRSSMSRGGKFNPQTNVLVDVVQIPANITTNARQVLMHDSINQLVSRYIANQVAAGLFDKISKSWKILIDKITIQAVAEFDDGSTATYYYSNIFSSYDPYILDINSIEDKYGNQITVGDFAPDRYFAQYAFYAFGGKASTIGTQCRNHVITTSDGGSFSGTTCWSFVP